MITIRSNTISVSWISRLFAIHGMFDTVHGDWRKKQSWRRRSWAFFERFVPRNMYPIQYPFWISSGQTQYCVLVTVRETTLPTTKKTEDEGLVGRTHSLVLGILPSTTRLEDESKLLRISFYSNSMMVCRRQSNHQRTYRYGACSGSAIEGCRSRLALPPPKR